MEDCMDIDTPPSRPPSLPRPAPIPPPPTTPIKPFLTNDPHNALEHVFNLITPPLHTFISRNITRALGEEYLSIYLPSPSATLFTLLKFITDKWISIFADSTLGEYKETHRKLVDLVRQVTDSRGVILSASNRTADDICIVAEQIMSKMSLASIATHISSVRRGLAVQKPLPIPQRMDTSSKQLIILDGSNIAWRHGHHSFSLRGAWLAYKYFRDNHHPVVLYLPEPRLQSPSDPDYRHVALLRGSPNLVLTPGTDYDDAYLCFHARLHQAVVVSNDKFEDVVYQACADATDHLWRQWFKSCRLSFTFCQHAFIPNPAFHWQRARAVAARLVLKQ